MQRSDESIFLIWAGEREESEKEAEFNIILDIYIAM